MFELCPLSNTALNNILWLVILNAGIAFPITMKPVAAVAIKDLRSFKNFVSLLIFYLAFLINPNNWAVHRLHLYHFLYRMVHAGRFLYACI
jgi:fumarate reductase subunit D